MLAIGLKSPGTPRGVGSRGQVLLSRAGWDSNIRFARSLERVRVVSVDSTHLPVVRLKVRDMETMSRIRRLPWVDYAEPNADGITPMSGGCMRYSYSGDDQTEYGNRPVSAVPAAGGVDSLSSTLALGMRVVDAWRLTNGAGVTVGVTDTGLDLTNNQYAENFAEGLSTGRTIRTGQTFNTAEPGYIEEPQFSEPVCSHGTRISGIATAPRDGRGAVGVAYGANLYAVYQADGEVVNTNGWAAAAIHHAARNGAKVIIMAWGKDKHSTVIQDEINSHHYDDPDPSRQDDDVVFVGAAGTCNNFFCYAFTSQETAVFPASMEEVLAVASASPDGSRPSDTHDYGSKSGVTAYTHLATTGKRFEPLTVLGGSSGATAAVGGIAALVRARLPHLKARQVMNRLIGTSGWRCEGPYSWRGTLVNAYAAVGGACVSRIWGNTQVVMMAGASKSETFSVNVLDGSGQFDISWSNGETGPQATYTFELAPGVDFDSVYLTVQVTDRVYGVTEIRGIVVQLVRDRSGDPDNPCPGGDLQCY